MTRKPTNKVYDPSLRPELNPGQLGDWASILAIALFIALWLIWPRFSASVSRPKPLPEPSCAYVVLAPPSYSPLTMHGNFNKGMAPDGYLDKLPSPPLPAIPAAAVIPSFTHPDPSFVITEDMLGPTLSAIEKPAYPYQESALMSTGITVTVSKSLQDADFVFERPDVKGESVSFVAHLAFSGGGECISLLIDKSTGADNALLPWRTALWFSHTSTNASGTVYVR